MKSLAKALAAFLVIPAVLMVAGLAFAASPPATPPPAAVGDSPSYANVGPPLAGTASARPAAPAPAAAGLQVVTGTVAPETGVRLDDSGAVSYSGTDAASVSTERRGDTVVTTVIPRY